jgi:hypothetical protein
MISNLFLYQILYMNTDNICYTGIGSIKSGNHTQKQFLKIMNKNSKKECSIYNKSIKCKSCKKFIKMNIKNKIKMYQIKNKPYNTTNKTERKLLKNINKCNNCKKNNTKKCDLQKYISFSGAKLGMCKQ